MAWTGIWGAKIVQPYNSFPGEKSAQFWESDLEGAESVVVKTHGDLNMDLLNEVPWNLELTPMPVSAKTDGSVKPLTLDEVFKKAQELDFRQTQEGVFSQSFRVALPRDPQGVYSILSVTMSGDINNPFGDRSVHLDQYSGKVLTDIGWNDYNPMAKAMAAGIALHKGVAGWWNLILAALICAGVILLSVTGVVLWWKRRSQTTDSLLNPPPRQSLAIKSGGERVVVSLTVVSGILFPLAGAAMLVFLLIEWLIGLKASRSDQIPDLESS
jgi:uncharacterized iron-regulated membrane protein